MEKQTILIKGMVCTRCMMIVKKEFESLGHDSVNVSLGSVSFTGPPASHTQEQLRSRLSLHGFTVIEDKKKRITDKVKRLVEELYSGSFDFPESFRFAKHLTQKLGNRYEAISDAFIFIEKKTIEQYVIEYRIHKVKEFLVYTTYTLADIAFKLNFNSVAHLSTQFKQYTGLTPSFFKEIKRQKTYATFCKN